MSSGRLKLDYQITSTSRVILIHFRGTEDQTGGHWQYPLSSESTKRDSDGEWVSWIPTAAHRNRRSKLSLP